MRILIIEDEPDLRNALALSLRDDGYAVDTAGDGRGGLEKYEDNEYDAVLLDINLPGMSGWGVLQRLRDGKSVPVIMLTAREALEDRVRGLDTGADDYLVKPFALAELKARLRVVLRRRAGTVNPRIKLPGFTVDPAAKTVLAGTEPVMLTPTEYNLIEYLAMHRGRVISRAELYTHLFDEFHVTLSNNMNVHIANIRRKLGDGLISTRRGHGYCIP